MWSKHGCLFLGIHYHYPTNDNNDTNIVFSPQYRGRVEKGGDISIDFVKNPKALTDLENFLWSVKKAQSFKADFVSDLWCILELRGESNGSEFKIMVRGEKGKVKFYLYEIDQKMPIVPVLEEAQNPRECLGLILELEGDPISFRQHEKKLQNSMRSSIIEWAKKLFELNGLSGTVIHFEVVL